MSNVGIDQIVFNSENHQFAGYRVRNAALWPPLGKKVIAYIYTLQQQLINAIYLFAPGDHIAIKLPA